MKQDKAWGSSAAQISMPRARGGRGGAGCLVIKTRKRKAEPRAGQGRARPVQQGGSLSQPSTDPVCQDAASGRHSRCVQVGPTGARGEGTRPAKLSQHHSTAAVSPVQALVRASRWPLANIREKLCQHHRQAPVVTLRKAVSPQHLINNQALRVGVRTQ